MEIVNKILLAGFALLLSSTANASFIDGSTMTLTGFYSPDPANATNLTTITAITLDTVGANGAASDTFATTIGWGIADETGPYTQANLVGFTSITNFLTFAGWQLDLDSLVVESDSNAGFLHLSGTGSVSGNGEALTDADWSFSAHNTTSYTMSVTATVVPVPAAVWLFGSGLLGLAGYARRKA